MFSLPKDQLQTSVLNSMLEERTFSKQCYYQYLSNTVKGLNFAVLKVRGFLDRAFHGGFNFADYSIATYI